MSRAVSTTALRSMFAQESDEVFLIKIKLSHDSFSDDILLINDLVNHTDGYSVEWIGYPFTIVLPDETDDTFPSAKLVVDNVDRSIVQLIRSTGTAISATMWVVLGSDIDDVVAGPYEFSMLSVQWNALTVSGSLEYEPILNMRYPAKDFTPVTTPGLFNQ